MTNQDFGTIFGVGTLVYGLSFIINGPMTDKLGGRRMILTAALGSAIMNALMGLFLYGVLASRMFGQELMTPLYGVLYALNMYFQSMGAVAIVKVNSAWFHVRERGNFSGIFGAMIATGLFFAFDVSVSVLKAAKGMGPGGMDAKWWVFFAPSIALFTMFMLELFLLKDRPSQAGHTDFDTGDASSGEDDVPLSTFQLYKRILSHPVILTIAFIEFCSGVLRNGVMHWFPIYAKATVVTGGLGLQEDHFLRTNWGAVLLVAGIIGPVVGGMASDKLFQSRRGPSAGFFYFLLLACTVVMSLVLRSPLWLGVLAGVMSMCVIGSHGLLSGTATMDFGGRKAAGTAVGVIDGFVYLGTAVQSFSLGYLTSKDWGYWPLFMIPFAITGSVLCIRIWKALPTRSSKSAH
jgi:OPA family glycerol-3-phosphate transporter-like MFS transporter